MCSSAASTAPWRRVSVQVRSKATAARQSASQDPSFVSTAQDVTGYPTLKFFKAGVDEGVKYRGQRDIESLSKYVEEQMGRGDQKEEEVG